MSSDGIGLEDLREIYREEYLHAVETARARCDPAEDWDGFVEALWALLVPAFGLNVTVVDEATHRQQLVRMSERPPGDASSSPGEVG